MKFEKAQIISLKGQSEFGGEKLVQAYIAENPESLGLGALELIAKEKIQSDKGRLDLLLGDVGNEEDRTLYEVEIQLGPTDPSHIIRTISYWDNEKRLNPDYNHVAVLIAEDITSRFFNVINLFNRAIPIIAFQMTAFKLGGEVGLIFTKLLDLSSHGRAEKVLANFPTVDRSYWDQKSPSPVMQSMDRLFERASQLGPDIQLKFNKNYIGTSISGATSNFITFSPQKKALRLSVHIDESPEITGQLESKNIEYEYIHGQYPRYRLRLVPSEVTEHLDFLRELISNAYQHNEGALEIEHV
jgi:predicted transport protein